MCPKNKAWFRFYERAVTNPKIMALTDTEFRFLINLWVIASQNAGKVPYTATQLAHMIYLSNHRVPTLRLLSKLIENTLVLHSDRIETTSKLQLDCTYEVPNWKELQYEFPSRFPENRTDLKVNYGKKTESIWKENGKVDPDPDTDTDIKPPTPTPSNLPEKPEQLVGQGWLMPEQVNYFLKTYPEIDLDYHLRKMIEDMSLKQEPIKNHFKLLKYRLENSNGDYKKLPQLPKPSIGLRLGEKVDPERQPIPCDCGQVMTPILSNDEKTYLCQYCGAAQ